MNKHEIIIRLQLPRAPRHRWLLGSVAAIVCVSAVVYATVPNTFNAGDPLSSSKVNANFTSLDTRVGTLEGALAGGKVAAYAADGAVHDTAVHTLATISLAAPAAGTVFVASTGTVAFYTHTTGTQDVLICCLDGGANCSTTSYSYEQQQVPASWPSVPGGTANFDISWPLTEFATIPVTAKGTVTVNLNCAQVSGDGNGFLYRSPRLQAFYLPGQY